jgi:hypothetical protein
VQRPQRDTGIPVEQLEHLAPPLPVEVRTHSIKRSVSCGAGGCIPEMVADCAQRHSHAGYTEVQRPALLLVDCGSDCPRAAEGGIAVPVVTKVTVSL